MTDGYVGPLPLSEDNGTIGRAIFSIGTNLIVFNVRRWEEVTFAPRRDSQLLYLDDKKTNKNKIKILAKTL